MNEMSILNQTAAEQTPGFWRRQFRGAATRPQMIFDGAVGIVLPILCLIFDPFVFRGGTGSGGGLLKSFQLFAYTVIALEVLTLGLWLVRGERSASWRSAIGGILLAGALFSFLIALVLLPFSVLGLALFFIGALGFTPFFTGFIYLRNGLRALRQAREGSARGSQPLGALVLGVVFALGGPGLAQWKVSRMVEESMQELVSGDARRQAAAASKLKRLYWIMSLEPDALVWAYASSTDTAHKDRLARAYRELTGQDIERRLLILLD